MLYVLYEGECIVIKTVAYRMTSAAVVLAVVESGV